MADRWQTLLYKAQFLLEIGMQVYIEGWYLEIDAILEFPEIKSQCPVFCTYGPTNRVNDCNSASFRWPSEFMTEYPQALKVSSSAQANKKLCDAKNN